MPAATRPPAIQHDPSLVRESVAGPDSAVAPPYPVYLQGWVTRGFGRGSKDLGCPTANLPDSSIEGVPLETGVHFGFARVVASPAPHDAVYPMVMSIGWNPFYNNETRTAVSDSPPRWPRARVRSLLAPAGGARPPRLPCRLLRQGTPGRRPRLCPARVQLCLHGSVLIPRVPGLIV